MGGRGSGNHFRWGSKGTTGAYRSIDVRRWARDGLLTPGGFVLSWQNEAGKELASITVTIFAGALPPTELMLIYRSRSNGGPWRDVQEPIALVWTPCHYGGRRPWFVCPGLGCGRRVALLYLGNPYWVCRHCLGLVYQSQRDEPTDRYRRRARKLVAKLGGGPHDEGYFLPKPKGMHQKTYRRLQRAAMAAEMDYNDAFITRLAYLSGATDTNPRRVSQALDELLG